LKQHKVSLKEAAMYRAPLIVVVGVCASGKTTLVEQLRSAGYSALEVAQEHSDLPYLWARSAPAFVVYLEAKNRALQRRRGYLTTERLERERQSLAYARSRADLIVSTEDRPQQAVLEYVVDALEAEGIDKISWEPERPTENWGDVD
jgi:molybdopterin-guanine dinucleotide biosynthesis protein